VYEFIIDLSFRLFIKNKKKSFKWVKLQGTSPSPLEHVWSFKSVYINT